MFDDTLHSSWDERSRLGLTTFTSFGLQALALGVLLLLPLLRPTAFPLLRPLSAPVSLGQPLTEAPAARARANSNSAASNFTELVFRRPSSLRFALHALIDDRPPQIAGTGSNIPGTLTGGDLHGVSGLFDSGARPVLPAPPPPAVAHLVRLSHMSEGDLIRKVQPAYPALARSARIQGTVLLQAVISKQGTIENVRVLNGHPLLVTAAIDAVRQWRYRPYVLNSEPVKVETQITVNFSLAGN
jgi:protein TonB